MILNPAYQKTISKSNAVASRTTSGDSVPTVTREVSLTKSPERVTQ
jgi:hypothetical protein